MRDRNRQDRARAICDGALALFLERGVDAVSIDHIARAAGIGKATFYAYFDDKEQLVDTLVAPLRERALAALDRTIEQVGAARAFGELRASQEQLDSALFPVFVDHLDVLRLMLQESRGPAVGARRPLRQCYADLVERTVAHNVLAAERGLIRDLHPRVVSYIVLGAIERLVTGYLDGDDLGDPRAALRTLTTVLLDGLDPSS